MSWNSMIGTGLRVGAALVLISLARPACADEAWTSKDIGQVGVAGSSSINPDTSVLTIKASGKEIWDSADSFHYVYKTITGDADLVAHLGSIENTHEWSRTGLMVRQDGAENSVYAMMTQAALRGLHFQFRTAVNGGCGDYGYQTNGAPVWLRVIKDGNIVTGFDSPDGINWTCRGVITLPLKGPVEIGMALSSNTDGALCTATYDHINLTTSASFAPQNKWTDQDIGGGSLPGASHSLKGEVDILAAGHDIWDSADGFHYLSQPLNGDGSLVVRVSQILETDNSAKAGIMFREDDSPGSRHVSLLVTPNDGLYFLRRTTHDTKGAALSICSKCPLWLMLTRQGDTFTASTSRDGEDWKEIGKDVVPMNKAIKIGLAFAAHVTDHEGEATFDHLSGRGDGPIQLSP